MTPASSLSERRAIVVLAGAGMTPRSARKVLHAGLAGPAVSLPGVTLYDEARVRGLLEWPAVTLDDCSEVCPHGLLVLRRQVSVLEPLDAQLAAVSAGWDISDWTALRLTLRLALRVAPRSTREAVSTTVPTTGFPALVTVGGFVATGAEVTQFGPRLGLVGPGDWFARFAGRRLPAGPGKSWFLLGEPRSITGVSGRGEGLPRVGESAL